MGGEAYHVGGGAREPERHRIVFRVWHAQLDVLDSRGREHDPEGLTLLHLVEPAGGLDVDMADVGAVVLRP